jgi:TRAP-type C4-dicarboxylate transport system permease small subunit
LLSLLRRGADLIGVILFGLLFLVFVVQVCARFVFGKPLPWTDEAATVLYLWAVLWGAAVVCKDREHVAFDLLYQSVSAPVRRWMALCAAGLIGSLAAWSLPGVIDYIYFMRRESSAVMGVPLHWIFMPFALLLLALVVRYVIRIRHLFGRHWERHL